MDSLININIVRALHRVTMRKVIGTGPHSQQRKIAHEDEEGDKGVAESQHAMVVPEKHANPSRFRVDRVNPAAARQTLKKPWRPPGRLHSAFGGRHRDSRVFLAATILTLESFWGRVILLHRLITGQTRYVEWKFGLAACHCGKSCFAGVSEKLVEQRRLLRENLTLILREVQEFPT
ncbi:hypothetical protein PoB_003031400 [Plakobranchus ocellatus]|uniref:Uncharacterized protein n=1 Tax=Plakobranchus ocellatus TaxID=259542 RepID=A0AAV4AC51_9GAST|nr:hypothetical protein PoB_003031400 [Plakobranchus ocellatus]